MYSHPPADIVRLPVLSRQSPQATDEPYDTDDINTSPLSQRRQRLQSLPHQPLIQSRPSSSSGSTRTLRRTPRFEQQKVTRSRVPIVAVPDRPNSAVPLTEPAGQPTQALSEDGDGSTTPRPSRQAVRTSSYWPRRSIRISRRTASAILYALEEAIRTPHLFTPDLIEENASMSDLGGGGSTQPGAANGRAQNGGSRAASGSGPTPQYATPREIMRQRKLRMEKKNAENEARQKEREGEETRPSGRTDVLSDTTGNAIANPSGTDRSSHPKLAGASASTRAGAEGPVSTNVSADKRPPDRGSGGSSKANQPAVYVPATSRKDTTSAPTTALPRQRANTVSQEQTRSVPQQQAPRAASYSTQPQPRTRQTSTAAVNSKEQADTSGPASAFRPQVSQDAGNGTQPRSQNASSFPHAFERWETLSSHWEGLTSYWMRRLDENSNEMNREPLNQQMARQVTDLSAAGANLFHAVVELQRLRASSERKFQRWFFETRAEQERAQEVHAGMENTLRIERQAHADAVANVARAENEKNIAYQKKSNADQMVKEMKRELQISKEEARRAWEELGRREQEERDRTDSLRNGEPTLVGGVQVVPMLQGAPSRQGSSNRPSTREGPYTQGANVSSLPTQLESSLEDDPRYTTYDPTRSETDTDPFTEGGRTNPSQPSYQPPALSLSAPTSQPQPQTSNGTTTPGQTAKGGASPSNQPVASLQAQSGSPSATASSTYLNYGPGMPVGQPAPPSFYQHEGPTLHQDTQRPRTSEADERSYVQSVDTLSEEDYELNDDGEIRRDFQGRPIVRRALGSEDSDELDVRDQIERERMYGRSYGSGIAGVEYGSGPTDASAGRAASTYTATGNQGAQTAPVDYSGNGYGSGPGWEAVPRNHHPTRLSDVLEEDERSRTSPSRASQTSRGLR